MTFALPDRLNQLTDEQERLDALRDDAVRRHGPKLCDLAYANPYDGTPDVVLDAIHDALQSTRQLSFQYTPYGGATISRRLVAQSLARESGVPYQWRDIILTPGAMAGLNIIFRAVMQDEQENEIVVVTPCWLDYPLYLENLGVRAVLVPLAEDTLRLDFAAISAALSSKTRAVILSQPANPSGLVYSESELQQLADLLENEAPDAVLISDECHRDFSIDPVPSPARFYANTCVIYSFGKRLLMQGQRIGYIAVSPNMRDKASLTDLCTQLTRVMGFCTPTALMQLAIRKLIDVKLDHSGIFERQQTFVDALRAGGYEIIRPQATFFIYPKTPIDDDFRFTEMLADNGILAIPAGIFHGRGHFRLSVTADAEHLEQAAERMIRMIENLG